MGRLVLVIGGTRSGKSRLAESLAAAEPPVTYLATAVAGDAAMAQRIEEHRGRRLAAWHTMEEPWDVAEALGRPAPGGCVLLECVPLWLTNLLMGLPGRPALDDGGVRARVEQLLTAVRAREGTTVVVSAEVGWGLLPANDLGRRFADLLGETNQALAAQAAEVHACVAGIRLRLK